jgi:hypothetical protein
MLQSVTYLPGPNMLQSVIYLPDPNMLQNVIYLPDPNMLQNAIYLLAHSTRMIGLLRQTDMFRHLRLSCL